MKSNTISNLVELLENYKVKIPMIQRDYAHGREDEHAKQVRTSLLNDIKKAIQNHIPLDLNFIYGKEENGIFIPIDGQQRLTTLFLFYLYIYGNDKEKKTLFYHFSYETRISSRDFLVRLIDHAHTLFYSSHSPSFEIQDAEWFVRNWLHDPTIKSVLVVLDEIKEMFYQNRNFIQKQMNEGFHPVTFHFLEMNDLGMEDSLYIKLNARGKPLTKFENFKALLLNQVKEVSIEHFSDFEQFLDGKWTDFFWDTYFEKTDTYFYRFFGILFMNYGIIDNDTNNWEYTLDYKDISNSIVDAIYYTLNFLSASEEEGELKKYIIDALDTPTYQSRVLFHAIVTYLLENNGNTSLHMKEWIRVIRNLTYNSQIDKPDLYHKAIDSVNALVKHSQDIHTFLAYKNKIAFFHNEQVKEEQIKAQIILENKSFAQKIYLAEKHPYFKGQIRGALYLSKGKNDKYDEQKFAEYWEKIACLFNDKNPKDGNLLRRSLLTFGDYTLPVSQFMTLCVNDAEEAKNNPSLKALFSKKYTFTKQLLDKIQLQDPIAAQLQEIIENHTIEPTDWRYCFITYPELFSLMSESYLRLRKDERLNNTMLIIKNMWANGQNYDLFLSALREELKRRKIDAEHDTEQGLGIKHNLFLEKWNYQIIFDENRFVVNENEKAIFTSTMANPILETATFIEKKINKE